MRHEIRRATRCALFAITVATPTLASGSTFTTLYSFKGGADGAVPEGALLAKGGTLFGTAQFGGAIDIQACGDGCGVVFSINPQSGAESVVYAFQGGKDGMFPSGDLLTVRGKLYGTTELGGEQKCNDSTNGCGTVYSLDPVKGYDKVLYTYGRDGKDGEVPMAGVTLVNGTLYGTTAEGGNRQSGNIYAAQLTGGGTGLVSFPGLPKGLFPESGLLASNGVLYGTTQGEAYDYGTVFTFTPSTGKAAKLHAFDDQDGEYPSGTLIAYNSLIYGTTAAGGSQRDGGEVYSIDPVSGTVNVIYAFGAANGDGTDPTAGVIAVGHWLYGTTKTGGSAGCNGNHGCGTLFRVNPATGTEEVLYRFTGGADEGNPAAGLIYYKGAFYGTTSLDGQSSCYNRQDCGTVFKFVP